MTVSDIKSEWIRHHSTRNNIRKNDTGLTGTMHYDIFLKYSTVTNGSAAFDTLQPPIRLITVYYICIHELIMFVTILHLITPQ